MTDHPLTETAVAELWDAHVPERKVEYLGWKSFPEPSRRYFTAIIRDAFDAGREHGREHTDPYHDPRPWQDCTRKDICAGDLVEARVRDRLHIGVAHHQPFSDGDWYTEDGYPLTDGDRWPLRRIPATPAEKDTPMTETTPSEPSARTLLAVPDTHGAPHHDADRIKAGDYVMQVGQSGVVRHGIAHHQDEDGDWATEGGKFVAVAAILADRPDALTVWPAPTPPAEEVTLPTEHPAHITDVETSYGTRCAYMALDRDGDWCGVDQHGDFRTRRHTALAAFTLPDGTRARLDGEHEDGTPRFVKENDQ